MSLLAKAVERFVVNRLPYRQENRNGVVVGRARLIERDGENLEYKAANCDALRREVDRGDHVVVIGGGRGVSTVVAARATGPYGTVDSYEATSGLAERVNDTAIRNNVADWVYVHHAIVGAFAGGEFSEDVFGPADGHAVPASGLPDCDVLEMDCEGAEKAILAGMVDTDLRPRVIIVETHGFLGSPTDETRELLDELGYYVTSSTTVIDERDNRVLVARRNDGRGATA